MSEIGGDISTIVTRLGADLSRESAKMTNEAIKQMLLLLIRKAKEQSDKPGEMALRKLIQSKDEIKILDLDQNQLKAFNELAKKHHISYAVVKDQNQYSVFYKQGEESRIKLVLEKLIERELGEKEIPDNKIENEGKQLSDLSLKENAGSEDKTKTILNQGHVQEEVNKISESESVVKNNNIAEENVRIDSPYSSENEEIPEFLKLKRGVNNTPVIDTSIVEPKEKEALKADDDVDNHSKSVDREERTTLDGKLGRPKSDDRFVKDDFKERLSLAERRQEIKPLMETQKQAPPSKNKNKERGGR